MTGEFVLPSDHDHDDCVQCLQKRVRELEAQVADAYRRGIDDGIRTERIMTKCDADSGPCSCGAWHKPNETPQLDTLASKYGRCPGCKTDIKPNGSGNCPQCERKLISSYFTTNPSPGGIRYGYCPKCKCGMMAADERQCPTCLSDMYMNDDELAHA